ncbi:DotU family type IV/VI secretion system protein [Caulobacter segnis]
MLAPSGRHVGPPSPVRRSCVELYHACLASGFEGRYRILPDGKRQLHEIMVSCYAALDHGSRPFTDRAEAALAQQPDARGAGGLLDRPGPGRRDRPRRAAGRLHPV